MFIGAHVSSAGGAHKAPSRAHEEGLECFQFFSRSPQGGKAPVLTPEIVSDFKSECKKYGIVNTYIHTPYYINFCSTNNRIRYGSISVVREELERASLLGVRAVMTHLGSAKDMSHEEGVEKVIEGLNKMLEGYEGSATFLIENSAGAGDGVGGSFEEVGYILKSLKQKNVGVCLDTQHSFGYGYDWRDVKKAEAALREFDKHVGLKHLVMMQVNDSKVECGEKKDRHEHIGKGYIGKEAFAWFVRHPKLAKVDMVLETEFEGRAEDVKILKSFRKK